MIRCMIKPLTNACSHIRLVYIYVHFIHYMITCHNLLHGITYSLLMHTCCMYPFIYIMKYPCPHVYSYSYIILYNIWIYVCTCMSLCHEYVHIKALCIDLYAHLLSVCLLNIHARSKKSVYTYVAICSYTSKNI